MILSLTLKWDSEERRVILPSQCVVADDSSAVLKEFYIEISHFELQPSFID